MDKITWWNNLTEDQKRDTGIDFEEYYNPAWGSPPSGNPTDYDNLVPVSMNRIDEYWKRNHDSPKANKDSTELYKLIEKEIEQEDKS